MRKKIFIATIASIFAANAAFADTTPVHDTAVNAIKLTKAAGDYGKFTIQISTTQTSTIRIPSYQLQNLESQFLILVDNYWTTAQTGSTGFIQYLQLEDQKRLVNSQSGVVNNDDRVKYMLWDKFYTSFMQILNNPNTVITTTTGTSITGTTIVYEQERIFYQVRKYTTISGKTYTIRKSNDNMYWFSKTAKYGFSSQNQLMNFLEQQNRIIYQAPNGRMYGIFRSDGAYYFNRDEGSISNVGYGTLEAIQNHINKHNQPVKNCEKAKERKCI